jgi:hypothetical protein
MWNVEFSRLESPGYEGHSLSMLRRVAKALSAKVRVVLEPEGAKLGSRLAEFPIPYRVKRGLAKQPRRAGSQESLSS